MNLNLQQLVQQFFQHLAGQVRSGEIEQVTLDWYKPPMAKLLSATWKSPDGVEVPLATLQAAEIRMMHLSGLTLTNALARGIRRCFHWAAGDDIIPKDPMQKLSVPACGERERVLTRSEMLRLYRGSPRNLRKLLLLLRHTMARPGEILNLKWHQIDWKKRLVVWTEFKAKKKRSDKLRARSIALDRVAHSFLQSMYKRAGCPSRDSHLFYSDRTGRPWTAHAAQIAMRLARAKAGLEAAGEERVVCYTQRHTAATVATMNGVSQKLLAELLGHARLETTERYQHIEADHLVNIIDSATARRRPNY